MFDDSLLDDADALTGRDPDLRRLAESGARVRREAGAAADVLAGLSGSRPRAVVVAGQEARLLRAVLEPWCPVPFVAWPGPGLPGWAGSLDLVLVLADRSGDDSATSAVAEAVRRGCTIVVACPPHSPTADLAAGRYTTIVPTTGDDPLASAVVVLKALHHLDLGPEIDGDEVAAALDDLAGRCSPFEDLATNPAKDLASAIGDDDPLVWGGSVLAARGARRIAEALRRESGRTALAADAEHLLPLLVSAPVHDVFADPFEGSGDAAPSRPVLMVVDDGAEDPAVRESRGRLAAAAERRGVRMMPLHCDRGSQMARYASLLMLGRYAACYLAIGLGRTPAEDDAG